MAGQTFNWIADKLLIKQQRNNVNLGQLRAARRFDRNNQERVINDVTGRLGSASQRLAIAQGLGLQTQGLIIGGRRDGGQTAVRGQGVSPASATTGVGYGKTTAGNRDPLVGGESKYESTGKTKKKPGTGLPSAPITPE